MSEKKFTKIIDLKGWKVLSDEKYVSAKKIAQTEKYKIFIVKTDKNMLKCADNHILFDENYKEIFAKDLSKGDMIVGKDGLEKVLSVEETDEYENMYDVEVDDDCHRYYTNGILSHNTTTVTAFLLHYILFNFDKKVAVLANKGAMAREILNRIMLGYQHLPRWLAQGVRVWNKGSIELENGCSIIAAATSSDSVRGSSFSCVTGDTKITILDDFGNIWIDDIKNAHSSKYIQDNNDMITDNKKYYYVYKIVNIINNKEYIGFHSTNNLNDGYMGSGKLLIKAIEKYGINNFKKEIIKIFDNKKEAEELERILVNEEYINKENTYNISIGGNVSILPGEKNGFYGKTHSKETIEKIKEHSEWYYDKLRNGYNRYLDDDVIIDGVRYNSYNHAKKQLKIGSVSLNSLLVKEGNGYVNQERQQKLVDSYNKRQKEKELNEQIRREKISNRIISDETRKKMSIASKNRIHTWQDKVNKNPEKIRKTAEKHRGMKRSDIAKQHMSEAQKKRFAKEKQENNNAKSSN